MLALLLLLPSLASAAPDSEGIAKALRKGTVIDRVVSCPDKNVQLLEVTHAAESMSAKAVAVAVLRGQAWTIEELVHFRDGEEGNSWAGCKRLGGRLVYWLEFWSLDPDTSKGEATRKIPGFSVFWLAERSMLGLSESTNVPKGKVDVADDHGKGLIISVGGKKHVQRSWEQLTPESATPAP